MGLRRSQVHPPAQSTETPEIRPGHLMCLWTVLKSSNRRIDTNRKKQQMKTLTPLLHSLLLFRYNFLLTQVFFQFNSLNLLLCLYTPLSCSEQSRGLKRECCTETEMSGTSHLRQSCTWNVEPFVKKAVDSCSDREQMVAWRPERCFVPWVIFPSHAQHSDQNNALAAQQRDHTERSAPARFEARKNTKQ